ncbi:MAG: TonB-dependent receptor [Sandarakinorhabdus sp.]|nr:TonB-dependent receptor [Sandarakinorhabdus sp.]
MTAQKRPERLQETPLAVTAFTQAGLNAGAVTGLVEAIKAAPGVSFSSGNTARAEGVRIRGVGTASFSEGVTGSVATIVDGVVLGRQAQGLFELNDIERIEVLRGPQGTLYGATSTAGAINIVTQRPSDKFSAAADVQYGNYNEFRVRGTVSGPLAGDKLKARISGYFARRDGEVTNVVTGQDLNNRKEYGFRGKLEWQASDKLNLLLSADYAKSDNRCCSLTFRTVAAAPLIAPVVASASNRTVALNTAPSAQKNRDWGASLQANYDLGNAQLTSITAYRDWNFSDGGDVDFTVSNIVPFAGTNNQARQFSQELRIASTGDGPLNYIAGLYYFDQTLDADSRFEQRLAPLFVPGPTGNAIGQITESAVRTVKNRQYSAFAQLDYELTDGLKLIGGLRFTRIELGLNFARTNTNPLLGTITGAPFNGLLVLGLPTAFSTDNNDSNLSGKVGLQYQANSNLMAYGTYTRGYKGPAVRADSGDPIAGPDVAATARIAPETVDAFEAGVRSQFLDRRLTLNLTGFYSKFNNFQANTVNPANPVQQSLVNAGDVSTRGFELEVAARPIPDLSLGGSLAYVDARYGNIRVSCSAFRTVAGCTPTGAAFLLNLDGKQFQNAPKWTATANALYDFAVGSGMRGFARGEVQYRSSVFFAFNQDSLSAQPGYALLNASFGIRTADDRWSLTVYGKNLADKDYALTIARSALTPGSLQLLGQQRSYGAVAALRF